MRRASFFTGPAADLCELLLAGGTDSRKIQDILANQGDDDPFNSWFIDAGDLVAGSGRLFAFLPFLF